MWTFGCSNPGHESFKKVVGDPPLHTRQMVSVSRVLGDDIINGCSMSQCKLHCIQPLLRIDHECRVKICCPLLIMVMLPYEWKILKWNENYSKQTNKLIRGSILLKKVSTVRGRWCLDWQLLTPIPLNKQQIPTLVHLFNLERLHELHRCSFPS